MASFYADRINSNYKVSNSQFVDLGSRLRYYSKRINAQKLAGVVSEWKGRRPDIANWQDLHLCKARSSALDKILIDVTMQRELNMDHVCDILDNFCGSMVMSIQVYEDPERPSCYIAWEGQHTAVVLYIICVMILGLRPQDVEIPIVVYDVKQKAEIRRNFILLNGDAKKPLDNYDKFRQMIFGVKHDNATDPMWIEVSRRQELFEKSGLFVTSSKLGDEYEPGAFTLLADTIMSDNIKTLKDIRVTEMFCNYWNTLGEDRAVDAKEARQVYEYFDACHRQGIKVDQKYMNQFVSFCKNYFQADWNSGRFPGPFWAKAKTAYENWYRKQNTDGELDKNGQIKVRGFTTEWSCGGPFLIAQLKKSTNLKVPKFDAANGFIPDAKDLW